MSNPNSIAVLTSGGDAPGMNAAVRAVVRTAIFKGMDVYGVQRGYNGLITGEVVKMDLRSVSDIIHRGGTVLYTARSPKFRTPEGVKQAADYCRELGIKGVVVIGGDGSYGLPGTIDNDISSTDYTIGFDTAMNTAMHMVDNIRDTSQSHDRCSVVEVMGRNAGYLALHTGIACGATSILVPEIPCDLEKDVIPKITRTQATGKKNFIVIVAEGVGGTENIARHIQELTGIDTRATILGHVQRGGSPTVRDRVIATQMGYHAVELLEQGIGNRVVGIKEDKVVDFDIDEALEMTKPFEDELYKIADVVSI